MTRGRFAFARIHGSVHLVQVPATSHPSPFLTATDVLLYRPELLTIFRAARALSLHPADFVLLEALDERSVAWRSHGSHEQAGGGVRENDGDEEEEEEGAAGEVWLTTEGLMRWRHWCELASPLKMGMGVQPGRREREVRRVTRR